MIVDIYGTHLRGYNVLICYHLGLALT